MTIKEAILKSLEEINALTNYMEIYNHIVKNNYYGCSGKNSSINSFCFTWRLHAIMETRVKRIKQDSWNLFLLFNQNRQNIGIEVLSGDTVTPSAKPTKKVTS
jgi:hypothetical protein